MRFFRMLAPLATVLSTPQLVLTRVSACNLFKHFKGGSGPNRKFMFEKRLARVSVERIKVIVASPCLLYFFLLRPRR